MKELALALAKPRLFITDPPVELPGIDSFYCVNNPISNNAFFEPRSSN